MKISKYLIQLILAVAGLAFAFTWLILLFFIETPVPNRDIISMATGVILSKCISTLYDYYYGSSKSSQDNTDLLNKDNTAP
jgi:hypothetical protein